MSSDFSCHQGFGLSVPRTTPLHVAFYGLQAKGAPPAQGGWLQPVISPSSFTSSVLVFVQQYLLSASEDPDPVLGTEDSGVKRKNTQFHLMELTV